MMYYTDYDAPIGKLLLTSDGNNLTGIHINKQKDYIVTFIKNSVEKKDLPVFLTTIKWLNIYFSGQKPPKLNISLKPEGSKFRQEVWKMLCDIPYGGVMTYGDIAKKFDKRMSAQAIGNAVGHNPIAIIIPCHRVIGANGNLTGYAAGLDIKVKLLTIEQAYKDTFMVKT